MLNNVPNPTRRGEYIISDLLLLCYTVDVFAPAQCSRGWGVPASKVRDIFDCAFVDVFIDALAHACHERGGVYCFTYRHFDYRGFLADFAIKSVVEPPDSVAFASF